MCNLKHAFNNKRISNKPLSVNLRADIEKYGFCMLINSALSVILDHLFAICFSAFVHWPANGIIYDYLRPFQVFWEVAAGREREGENEASKETHKHRRDKSERRKRSGLGTNTERSSVGIFPWLGWAARSHRDKFQPLFDCVQFFKQELETL